MRIPIVTVSILLCATSCASSNAPDKVVLTGTERTEAISLAERRQALSIESSKIAADYQTMLNRIQEETAQLNIRAQEMCFSLKKSHKLDPAAQYQLNEWRGELIKIGVN